MIPLRYRFMRILRNPINAFLTLVVISAVAIVVTFTSIPAPSAPLPIYDEHGGPMGNIFDGAKRHPEFARSSWTLPKIRPCNVPVVRTVVEYLKRNAPFQSIQAFSCFSGCAGHYGVDAGPPCGGGVCGDSNYSKYFAREDLGGAYCDGWYGEQDGCNGCTCEEDVCNSCT